MAWKSNGIIQEKSPAAPSLEEFYNLKDCKINFGKK